MMITLMLLAAATLVLLFVGWRLPVWLERRMVLSRRLFELYIYRILRRGEDVEPIYGRYFLCRKVARRALAMSVAYLERLLVNLDKRELRIIIGRWGLDREILHDIGDVGWCCGAMESLIALLPLSQKGVRELSRYRSSSFRGRRRVWLLATVRVRRGGVAKLLERVDWRLSRYELRELVAAIKGDISKRETLSLIESGRENCLALVAVLLMQKSSLIGDGEVVGALKMVNGKEPSARCRRLLCEALVRSESFGESKLDFSVADMGLRGVRLAVRSGYSIGPFRGSLTQWQLHCFERLSATFKIAL